MRNVCMIGAGAIAAEHLAALDACGEARLLAVADLDAQRAGPPPQSAARAFTPITARCCAAKRRTPSS